MRRIQNIIAIVAACLLFSNCDYVLGLQVQRMYGKKVTFPYIVSQIFYGELKEDAEVPSGMKRMVLLFEDRNCSRCQASRLYEFYDLIDSCQNRSILPIVLFSGESLAAAQDEVLVQDYPFPVYFDEGGLFLKRNPYLSKNRRLCYFLIDEQDTIKFIGNPIQSTAMLTTFDSIVLNLSDNR